MFRNNIKMILVGNSSVGKTSFLTKISSNSFPISQRATIGASFKTLPYTPKFDKNIEILYGIWDTAGQEKYSKMTNIYTRGYSIILYVYDLTDKESAENLFDLWIDSTLEKNKKDNAIYVFFGNKNDISNDKSKDIKNYVDEKISELIENDMVNESYTISITGSVKTGENISEIMEKITNLVVNVLKFQDKTTNNKFLLIDKTNKNNIFDNNTFNSCCY